MKYLEPVRTILIPTRIGLIAAGAGLIAMTLAGAGASPAHAAETPRAETQVSLDGDPFNVHAEPSRGLVGSGLFDASRFSLRNSVSYGVASGSQGSRSSGLWLSEIGYRLADPLHLSVDVGAVLNPTNGEFLSTDNIYLHGFNLDYHPSGKFQVSLSYRNIPGNAAAAQWLSRGGSLFDDDVLGRPVSPWQRP